MLDELTRGGDLRLVELARRLHGRQVTPAQYASICRAVRTLGTRGLVVARRSWRRHRYDVVR